MNRPSALIAGELMTRPSLATPLLLFDTKVVCSVPAQPAMASGPRTYIWLAGPPKFVDADLNATKHPSLLIEGVVLIPFPGVGRTLSFEIKMVCPFGKGPLT